MNDASMPPRLIIGGWRMAPTGAALPERLWGAAPVALGTWGDDIETALVAYAKAFAAGPIPELTKPQRQAQALVGLDHVAALDPERGGTFTSTHYKFDFGDGRLPAFPGSAFTETKAAVDNAMYWASKGHDVYWGMGGQKLAETPSDKWPYRRKAIRQVTNTVLCRCLYVDIDVKAGAHATTHEAAEILLQLVHALGWEPTMVVGSGSGGLHVYWRLDEMVTPKQFAPLADLLKHAAAAHGLKIDPQCTSNVCCLLRVPGTWNFKSGEGKPVTLVFIGNKNNGDAP